MTQLITYAASDRNNYGDLLFPWIIERFARQEGFQGKIIHAAATTSTLFEIGALPTIDHRKMEKILRRSKTQSHVVFAGGEILGSGWFNLMRFVNPTYNYVYNHPIIGKVLRRTRLVERYFHHSLGVSYPFVLSSNARTRNTFSYNSVGALSVRTALQNEQVREALRTAKHLTVRDQRSSEILNAEDVSALVAPDSAIVISDLFHQEVSRHQVKQDAKYYFVQFNAHKGPEDLLLFRDNLRKARDLHTHDIKILLSPIGLALDHDDVLALQKLNDLMPEATLYIPNNIWETMSLIAHSDMYIGTSLHGAITAMSFQRPFIALAAKTPKLTHYLSTWDSEEHINQDFNEFFQQVITLQDRTLNDSMLADQKAQVYQSLRLQLKDLY